MFIGSAFLVFGIGALLVLICRLAVDAFPMFVAFTVGLWAYGTGAGPIATVIIALVTAGLTLGAGQLLFHASQNRLVRSCLVLLFAVPAAFAGYHVVLGAAHLTIPSDVWQHVLAGVGALTIGSTAAVRLAGSAQSMFRSG